MRDLDRWKDKVELQLDGRQIFFLFFGSAVCACLIFVLGVVVGRRVEAQRAAAAPAAAEDPLAVLDELGNAEEGLTFHSALLKDRDAPGRKAARPEAAEREDGVAKAEGRPGAKPEGKAEAQSDAKAEARSAAKRDEAQKGEAKPEGKAEARDKARAEARDKARAEAGDKARTDKGRSHFTLQLSAFATKGEANDFMRKLREAGYKPYLIESMVPGKGLMYRVRLGDYPSRDSALSAKSDFERKQKMVAYVAKL